MAGNEGRARARHEARSAPRSAKLLGRRNARHRERAKGRRRYQRRSVLVYPLKMGRGWDGEMVEQSSLDFFCFFAHANSLKVNSPLTATSPVFRHLRLSARALQKATSRSDRLHFSAQLHPSPPYTNTSTKMASAMCTVETVNGREYKVRDMAMADFGCVSDPPDEREHFPRHSFLRRFGAIAASRSTLRSARGSRVSSRLARQSRARRYLRCNHSCNTSSLTVLTT